MLMLAVSYKLFRKLDTAAMDGYKSTCPYFDALPHLATEQTNTDGPNQFLLLSLLPQVAAATLLYCFEKKTNPLLSLSVFLILNPTLATSPSSLGLPSLLVCSSYTCR